MAARKPKLTKTEQQKVSRIISKLKKADPGIRQDVAIARAISEVAPKKSTALRKQRAMRKGSRRRR